MIILTFSTQPRAHGAKIWLDDPPPPPPPTDAREWLATQPDMSTAWSTCENPEWLMRLALTAGARRDDVVMCACDVASSVSHRIPPHVSARDTSADVAIATARSWCANNETIEGVRGAYTRANASKTYAMGAARAAIDSAVAAAAAADDGLRRSEADIAVRAVSSAVSAARAARRGYRDDVPSSLEFCAIIRKRWPTFGSAGTIRQEVRR